MVGLSPSAFHVPHLAPQDATPHNYLQADPVHKTQVPVLPRCFEELGSRKFVALGTVGKEACLRVRLVEGRLWEIGRGALSFIFLLPVFNEGACSIP